jgi:6-pyruvoyltetrahydropterin/6-carboxytetrahydropterin synthase
MFRVTQRIDFCYGHRLLNYNGKCRFLHGHNGQAVITLSGEQLDSRGMLVDFSDIKTSLRTWIDESLDHRMILHRDDPALEHLIAQGEPLHVISANPTAENLAKLIFEFAVRRGLPVEDVILWETPKSSARYSGPSTNDDLPIESFVYPARF